jgi:cyclic-di-GMP phosphodiesterase TipF (flagellum assembly factor)
MGTFKGWAFAGTSAIAITASTVALWAFFGSSINGSIVLAGFLGLTATGLAAASYLRSGRAAENSEKMSGDIDILSRRLLRVESRLAEIERQPNTELRKTVAEVSGEIALLSGLLRDLASTVSGHDRDVATLAEELYGLRERAAVAAQERADERAHEQQGGAQRAQAHPGHHPAPAEDWTSQLADLPASAPPIAAPTVAEPTATAAPRQSPVAEPPAVPPSPVLEPSAPPANDLARAGSQPVQDAGLFDQIREPAPESPREQRKRAILAAFRDDRLEIHLQPVVSLPQRKTKFYEALARLRLDGDTLLVPAEFMPALEEAGLAPELDGKVAARAAAVARHLVNRGSDAFVTSNLSPAAVRTPGFLRALGRIMEAYPDVLGRLAFEISQRCWRTLDAETAGALDQLRAKGAFFLLDRAIDLRLDPLTLADRGVRYVKLPAQMLVDPQPGYGLDFEIADLALVLSRAGIKLVADRVEAERVVPDLIEFDIPLAQGFVFGAPRAVRTDIFGSGKRIAVKATDAAAAKAKPQRTEQAPAAQRAPAGQERSAQAEAAEPRLPYRSFLRRTG